MDNRLALLTDWVRQFDCLAEASPVPASSDASFRRYFRVQGHDSYIAVDAPPATENSQTFITISRYLCNMGINAPRVIEADLAQGFLLITDLGSRQYLDEIGNDFSAADDLYSDALDTLIRLQTAGDKYRKSLPSYDEALLRFELSIFREWLLERHLGLAFSAEDDANWQSCCDALVGCALKQPRVFVHRDYHSRNLMVTDENNPGVLDFQDALNGPYTYDIVSLLRDCYIKWPVEFVDRFANRFRDDCGQAVSVEQFRKDFDYNGMQRHLKAAGIFARLFHRDGKGGYLDNIRRTLDYVVVASSRYNELKFLNALLGERVMLALLEVGP
ncbi:MAG: phosphotransferase [Woeseiaceae bacterium]|nr:phosphotransferase [Woeseiaceae bacterium]